MCSSRARASRIAEDRVAQRMPVHRPVLRGARKRRLDRLDRSAALRLHPMHRKVGVEHRDARAAERRRRGRFSHADAAGQADDPQAWIPGRQQIRSDEAAQGLIHGRINAEPGAKARDGLIQQHPKPLDAADLAGTGGSQQRRFQRHIDDVGDRQARAQPGRGRSPPADVRSCRATSC